MPDHNPIAGFFLSKIGLQKNMLKRRFTKIFKDNLFLGETSKSGPGSSLNQTEVIRREIPKLLTELNAKSLIDAPCGDLFWLKEMDLPVAKYIGIDIVPEIIEENIKRHAGHQKEFMLRDITTDPLPGADVFLCRDCLVHLSFAHIKRALRNIKKSASGYLLTTTFPNTQVNMELENRLWRPLNLEKPPFNFSPPITLINEGCTENGGKYADKSLGLWSIGQLPL